MHEGLRKLLILLAATTAYGQLFSWAAGDALSQTSYYLINKSVLAALLLAYVLGTRQVRAAGLTGDVNLGTVPIYWPIFLLMALILLGPITPSGPGRLAALGAIALCVGFAEELMFRGLVFHWFRDLPVRRTILVSAFAFGAAHLGGLLVSDATAVILAQSVFASAVGAIMACARARDRSIWLPIAVHAGFDFAALAAAGSIGGALEDSSATIVRLLVPGAVMWLWAAWLIRRIPNDARVTPPPPGAAGRNRVGTDKLRAFDGHSGYPPTESK